MKRAVLLMAIVVSLGIFTCACQQADGETGEITTTKPVTDATSDFWIGEPQVTVPSVTDPSSLPEYHPGSILLEDQADDDYDFERKYRITYYRIWGEFLSLLTEEQLQDYYVWCDEAWEQIRNGETRNTMLLADVVKRYHISRTDFDQAVNEFIINWDLDQYDIIPEEYEPPNADIIYTFDNEIINHYYRYE